MGAGLSVVASTDPLQAFFELIFADEKGYVCVGLKEPGDPPAGEQAKFARKFFWWPDQCSELVAFCLEKKDTYEVYYAPALFSTRNSKKDYVLGSRVFWAEFDGVLPASLDGIPEPSIRVCSSETGREHWYWRTEHSIQPYDLERINRALTYALEADTSGWDANQILRPIGTFNHKRGREVKLLNQSSGLVRLEDFTHLPEPPPTVDAPIPETLPPIEDVVSRYKFKSPVWQLFKAGVPEKGKRSDKLVALGYALAEMQMPAEDIFAMLLNADERWGKFKGRNDQYKRLMEIVVRVKSKHPPVTKTEDGRFHSIGYKSLLATQISLEWVWEPFIPKRGSIFLTGLQGVGKTMWSLAAASHLVLGLPFLGYEVHKQTQHKIGFFSLEMYVEEIKFFLERQAKAYTPDQLDELEAKLRFFPVGEPLYLDDPDERARVEEVIAREQFTGLVFDSFGSLSNESLADERVRLLLDWNAKLRKETNTFTWFIHHHRKATADNRRPNTLSDVFGSQYITRLATTVLALWDEGNTGSLSVLPLKVKLGAKPKELDIVRDSSLNFHIAAQVDQHNVDEHGNTIVQPGDDSTAVV